ncbi:MAG: rhamnulokinase family protein [Verrucomicrobiales bacterium]
MISPSTKPAYIAVDLGAESGRVMLVRLNVTAQALEFQETRRFPTGAFSWNGELRWNFPRFIEEILAGIAEACSLEPEVSSVSVDSWGVDYVWSGRDEDMLCLPRHYRDARTDVTFPEVTERIGKDTIYGATGIQFMALNTIYQLADDLKKRPKLLELADQFLPIADAIHYVLSGRVACEETLASTTQLFDPKTRSWSIDLIQKLGFPERLLPPTVESGTPLGPVRPAIAGAYKISPKLQVVAGCSHDTAAAVLATPGQGEDWAFLSSGTWSLLGLEEAQPKCDAAAQAAGFTNELGHGGRIRFLKNIIGLWILQECRRTWEQEGQHLDYAELTELASGAEPLVSLIDPDHAAFLKPGNMPHRVQAYCAATGQPQPESPAALSRCIMESLALLYAEVLEQAQGLAGRRVQCLHLVGGGSKNHLLNQMTADATGIQVQAGPSEATAIGNALVQALALGHVTSIEQARSVSRASEIITTFHPTNQEVWGPVKERFAQLRARQVQLV